MMTTTDRAARIAAIRERADAARSDIPWLLQHIETDAALIELQRLRIAALTSELERLAACEPAHRDRIRAVLEGMGRRSDE